MTDRTTTIANLDTVYDSFGAVLDDLTPTQWTAQSLCPAWTMHGVAAHVTAIETVLLGWRPDDEHPFTTLPAVSTELSALSPDELRARYHDVVSRRRDELQTMTDEQFDASSITPVGPGTYGRFMEIRVFDIWVHERDIRVPLDLPGDDSGPAAEMSLDEVHNSLGYIVGKKIGLPDGSGIAIHLTGPMTRRLCAKVDGRASRVDELTTPDVTLTTDSTTFMLLACGRIDPDEAIHDTRITWNGDPELGAHAARHLAFTM